MIFSTLFLAVSTTLALPPGLLESVCWIESNHRPDSVNWKDGSGPSYGICQVKKETCEELGITGDLLDATENIACAGAFLRFNYNKYHDWKRAVCAYNKGHSDSDGNNRYTRKVFREWSRRFPKSYTSYLRSHRKIRLKETGSKNTGDGIEDPGQEQILNKGARTPCNYWRSHITW